MTSYSLLASSTNLHSLQTGYWSPVTITVLSAHSSLSWNSLLPPSS